MSDRHHWDYYQTLEDDLAKLTRYVHFSEDNFNTYSIEFARLLMAATQEVDVLFQRICKKQKDTSDKELGYRAFFSNGEYAKIREIEVSVRTFGLKLTPFKDWPTEAPAWWTATNRIKHERHNHFNCASLENVLNAISGLLIANIYFAHEFGFLKQLVTPTKLLVPGKLYGKKVPALSAFKFKMP